MQTNVRQTGETTQTRDALTKRVERAIGELFPDTQLMVTHCQLRGITKSELDQVFVQARRAAIIDFAAETIGETIKAAAN